ncbi:FG-GAP repeat protein [Vibrio sp. D420a]|uniref:FG-GAP-like repeat-containing protein n=1 Tax=Vibrio sp. D420a TaxID=2836895 RepID=UPI0025568A07|nr:FG-GAP-like repeat-containing protein [Vibrio sp. D420a]MDK9764694.1 FG-GAP repeat protein [Vibrio sp. D420a]
MKLKNLALSSLLLLNSQAALSYDTNSWMEDLFNNSKQTTPLNKIVIPGSHDSGAYDAKKYREVESGVPYPLNHLRNWSQTQTLNIQEQLNAGTRFLDFRIYERKGEYYFSHSLIYGKVSDMMNQVTRFLDRNSGEIVIIHSRFVHNENSTNNFYQDLCANPDISKHLINNTLRPTSTYEDLISAGNLIIIPSEKVNTCNDHLWPNHRIESFYNEKVYQRPNKIGEWIASELAKKQSKNKKRLYVEQHIVTPTDKIILNGVVEDFARTAVCKLTIGLYCKNVTGFSKTLQQYDSKTAKRNSKGWLYNHYHHGIQSNIVLRDFVNSKINRTLINLNLNNTDLMVRGIAEKDDSFGKVLSTGDYNGDGIDDLLVGYPNEDINNNEDAGAVSVIYGGDSLPSKGLTMLNARGLHQDMSGLSDIRAEGGDQFGYSIASGDFNNDGIDDVAIGSPNEDIGSRPNVGIVTVIYGSATGLVTDDYQLIKEANINTGNEEREDKFGFALASHDFDGDGYADLAIGAPYEDIGNQTNAGVVYISYGSINGLSKTRTDRLHQNSPGFRRKTAEKDDRFGYELAAGDFNGDGLGDLAIGVPFEDLGSGDNEGQVVVLAGSRQGLSTLGYRTYHGDMNGFPGTAERHDHFGYTLATGDFNSDGYDELIIGVPYEDLSSGGNNNDGNVFVLSGDSNGPSRNRILEIHQNKPGVSGSAEKDDKFGYALSTGDFDGDGYTDLAVGSPTEDLAGQNNAGKVDVFFGSGNGLVINSSRSYHQNVTNITGDIEKDDRFGYSLAAGDFDNDGKDDLVIGVPYEDLASGGNDNDGTVHVLYGDSNGDLKRREQEIRQGTQ